MHKDKIIAIIAGIIAIAVFSFFVISGRPVKKQLAEEMQIDNQEMVDEQLEEELEVEEEVTTTPAVKNNTVKKTAPAPAPGAITQSYADALAKYSASGYRFQFVNCKATPGKFVIKQGQTFMLDNRDGVAHKIKVGSVNFNVGAYGFAIATAKTLGLNYITCDGGGAAQIQVEP